jgi:hypothetical protein
MIGVETQRRAWRPGGRRPGHPRDRTVWHHRRCPAGSAGAAPVAAGGRDRPGADRRRAVHPGGHASPGRRCLGVPLAAVCPHPPARVGSFPARPVRLQQAAAGGVPAAQILHPGAGGRHRPVGRYRVGGRLHPGGVRPLPRDGQAFGPGRLGRLRLLRLPLALVLGVAAAPGLYPARPAGRLRAGQPQDRRARGLGRAVGRRTRAAGRAARAGHPGRQGLPRRRDRGDPGRPGREGAAAGLPGCGATARPAAVRAVAAAHRVGQRHPQGPA